MSSPSQTGEGPAVLEVAGNVRRLRTSIPDVKLLQMVRHEDTRGFFSETYNRGDFAALGITESFIQDNHSLSSSPGTFRGLHFQIPPRAQSKLVRVIHGAALDVAVDIRHESPTFGQHVAVVLSARNWDQLYVPEGFAHGFLTLEPDTEVLYKVSDSYAPDQERGIHWADPDLAIHWPDTGHPMVVSDRDTRWPRLKDCPTFFEY